MRISFVSRACTAAILIAACALSGCDTAAKEEAEPPTPVRTALAFAGPAAPTIRTNGMLVKKDEIRLSFKVGGVIRRLAVMEGRLKAVPGRRHS